MIHIIPGRVKEEEEVGDRLDVTITMGLALRGSTAPSAKLTNVLHRESVTAKIRGVALLKSNQVKIRGVVPHQVQLRCSQILGSALQIPLARIAVAAAH